LPERVGSDALVACTTLGSAVDAVRIVGGTAHLGHRRTRAARSWNLGISGDAARGFLRRVPLAHGASAMTLGHVVLGRSEAALVETSEDWETGQTYLKIETA